MERNRGLAQMKNFGGPRKIFQTRALEKNFESVRVHRLGTYYSFSFVCSNY